MPQCRLSLSEGAEQLLSPEVQLRACRSRSRCAAIWSVCEVALAESTGCVSCTHVINAAGSAAACVCASTLAGALCSHDATRAREDAVLVCVPAVTRWLEDLSLRHAGAQAAYCDLPWSDMPGASCWGLEAKRSAAQPQRLACAHVACGCPVSRRSNASGHVPCAASARKPHVWPQYCASPAMQPRQRTIAAEGGACKLSAGTQARPQQLHHLRHACCAALAAQASVRSTSHASHEPGAACRTGVAAACASCKRPVSVQHTRWCASSAAELALVSTMACTGSGR